jgi:threonine dehydratase
MPCNQLTHAPALGQHQPEHSERPMILPDLNALHAAAEVVHRAMPPTPQIRWPLLCSRVDADVWVKHENHSPVGAFKLRGGLVYFHELPRRDPQATGVIAATRGNHGQSVAFNAALAGLRAVIVVPSGNSPEKNASMRALGAELIEHGRDFQEAFEHAIALAALERLHFVPSFDEALVRGVASCALELFGAAPPLDAVYVPIGMGSGVCGAIAVRDALGLKTEIIGVSAASAPAYALSFAAGRPVSAETSPSVANGMACRVPDPDAVAVIQSGVARIVTVEETEIQSAMRHLFTDTHNAAEGAGAAALAALMKERDRLCHRTSGRSVAVILTGGNVDAEVFSRVLAQRE